MLKPRGALFEKFIIPPLSVLDARQGYWMDRKKKWLSLDIEKEVGRSENITGVNSVNEEVSEYLSCTGIDKMCVGTSKFDPFLAEIIYTWFSKKNDIIIDPFCGGSVRGIVAEVLGRKYYGVDIRQEQIHANTNNLNRFNKQYDLILNPQWYCGDSYEIDSVIHRDIKADLIFSCPPYVNLEVYSDNKRDLSTMDYEEFITAYQEIINKCYGLLKNNGFAVFVVGEVRDKKGYYYDFISDTKKCFLNGGFKLYNDLVLLELIGTASMRCGRFFKATRKITKTHQNVLVFSKGDAVTAAKALGEVSLFDIDKFINKHSNRQETFFDKI